MFDNLSIETNFITVMFTPKCSDGLNCQITFGGNKLYKTRGDEYHSFHILLFVNNGANCSILLPHEL